MPYCKNCGTTINDNTTFCPQCGARNDQGSQPNYSQPNYSQPNYGQPSYGQPAGYSKPKVPGRGFAIAGLVLGIIGLIAAFIDMVGYLGDSSLARAAARYFEDVFLSEMALDIVLCSLGVCFGSIAKKKGCVNGVANAGFITGLIGLACAVICIIVVFA